jgi:hypothetical protein
MAFDLSRALPYLMPTYSAEDTAPIHVWGSKDAPINRPFSGTLQVNYMVDEPGALVFIRERDVEKDKRDALHDQALANLRAHVQRRKVRFELKGPLHVAKLDSQHDASLLLLDELWDPPNGVADLEGELVAAVPARHILLFTGTGRAGGVGQLRASIVRTTDRALSPEVFVRRRGGWMPYDT